MCSVYLALIYLLRSYNYKKRVLNYLRQPHNNTYLAARRMYSGRVHCDRSFGSIDQYYDFEKIVDSTRVIFGM